MNDKMNEFHDYFILPIIFFVNQRNQHRIVY